MTVDADRTARQVAAELAAAHRDEDVPRYVAAFAPDASWVTSRGVLVRGREELTDYLSRVMPGGLAGGSVEYRVAHAAPAGEAAVVIVIDQYYRTHTGGLKVPDGHHRHTYVLERDTAAWRIVAGQNTTVVDAP